MPVNGPRRYGTISPARINFDHTQQARDEDAAFRRVLNDLRGKEKKKAATPPVTIPAHTHLCTCGVRAMVVGVTLKGCSDINATLPFCGHCKPSFWNAMRRMRGFQQDIAYLVASYAQCDSVVEHGKKFLQIPVCSICKQGRATGVVKDDVTACYVCGTYSKPLIVGCRWCERRQAYKGEEKEVPMFRTRLPQAPCDKCLELSLCACNACRDFWGPRVATWEFYRQARLFERDGTPMTATYEG